VETFLTGRLFPRMETVDERNWLPAAQNGELWALEHIYACYQTPLYALCYRILGRPEDAEDAMQAAFTHAFRALPGFRGECRIKTWIYRIAVNEALSLLRKRRPTEPPSETLSLPDSAPDVQRKLAVHAALARVRPDYRVALALHYWEGLSYEEMTEVLNLSLSAVKMRLNRAREAFRKIYGEEP